MNTLTNCSWYIHNHIRCIISFRFKNKSLRRKKRGLQTCRPPFWIYYVPHFSLWHTLQAHSPCDTGVICSSNYYLLNIMSVAKNLNQHQLQLVEMRLLQFIMFTFIATSNTTWSTAHAYCIILWSLKISLALHTWRPLRTLLELLVNIKEPHDLNYIES